MPARQVAATLRLELHELAGDAFVTFVLETRQAAGAQEDAAEAEAEKRAVDVELLQQRRYTLHTENTPSQNDQHDVETDHTVL